MSEGLCKRKTQSRVIKLVCSDYANNDSTASHCCIPALPFRAFEISPTSSIAAIQVFVGLPLYLAFTIIRLWTSGYRYTRRWFYRWAGIAQAIPNDSDRLRPTFWLQFGTPISSSEQSLAITWWCGQICNCLRRIDRWLLAWYCQVMDYHIGGDIFV